MLEKIDSKKLFYISSCIAGYFLLLCINAYILKSDFILIGYFQELLTIPMLLIQLFLFIFSIKYCIKDKFRVNKYPFWTFFVLLVSILFTFGSLLITIFNN